MNSKLISILVALGIHGMDLLTGLIGGIKEHNIQSSKMRDGLFKKLGFLLCYAMAYLIDTYGATVGFSINFDILPVVITYAVGTEVISIIENIHRINPDLLPDKLMDLFNIGGDNHA